MTQTQHSIDRTLGRHALALVLLTVALMGCAAHNADPYENVNRKTHEFNSTLDDYTLKPIARGYQRATPSPVQRGVTNFFKNLREPFTALNQLLQGKPGYAVSDLSRFVVNTTVGIGGTLDVGTKLGLKHHPEDFGQTLSVWGVKPGPYIVVPGWGPTSLRDGFGALVNAFGHLPIYLDNVAVRNSITALWVIHKRAALLKATDIESSDEYAFQRDAYLQHREYEAADGKVEDPFLDE